jgi:hypothetical protein
LAPSLLGEHVPVRGAGVAPEFPVCPSPPEAAYTSTSRSVSCVPVPRAKTPYVECPVGAFATVETVSESSSELPVYSAQTPTSVDDSMRARVARSAAHERSQLSPLRS